MGSKRGSQTGHFRPQNVLFIVFFSCPYPHRLGVGGGGCGDKGGHTAARGGRQKGTGQKVTKNIKKGDNMVTNQQ